MSNRRTRDRRRYFLLDSNQTSRRKPKRLRNQVLNFLSRFRFLRFLLGAFQTSTIFLLVLFCMGVFILFALFSPYFALKSINFTRDNPNINVEQVEEQLAELYGENLLFLDKKSVEDQLLTAFPEFRSVEIKEFWPDKIQIEIDLSEPVFTLFDPENATFAVISEDGVVLSDQSREGLPVIELRSFGRPFVMGEKIMTEAQVLAINQATTIFRENIGMTLEKRLFYLDALELHLQSKPGTLFMLDLQRDVLAQLRKLEYAEEEINWRENNFEHIDLRIPERLYYK